MPRLGGMFSEEREQRRLYRSFDGRIALRIFGRNGRAKGLDVVHRTSAVEVLSFTTSPEVFFAAANHHATTELAGERSFGADETIVAKERRTPGGVLP